MGTMRRNVVVALLLGLAVTCINCGEEPGRIFIPGIDTLPPQVTEEVPTLPRTAMQGVRIYGPQVRPAKFEIFPYYGILPINWDDLITFERQGMIQIDVDVRVTLEDSGNATICVRNVDVYRGGDLAGDAVVNYLKRVISTWCFTPYMTGDLYYRINIGRNEFIVDKSRLVSALPGKAVDIGTIWLVNGMQRYRAKLKTGTIARL
jgi:hypothetical protein